jgi:hypothetical protein
VGKALSMDAPALLKCEGLVAVRPETEKRADFVEAVTETRGGGEGFEPACRPVSLFDAPMVLFNRVHPD